MAAYCLPKSLSTVFLKGLKDGTIDPVKLSRMSSEKRREFFKKHLGEDNAREVNTLFESKLLLPNQQKAMQQWVRETAGIDQKVRQDIITKIDQMKEVLNPKNEQAFLSDLAYSKLGAEVTVKEAKEIFDLYQKAQANKIEFLADLDNLENQIKYGRSILDLTEKVNELKGNVKFDPKSMKSWIEHGGNVALNVWGLTKSLMGTADLSALGNQGWGMMTNKRWRESFVQSFKYLSDEEAFQDLRALIVSDPDFPLLKDAKLGITEIGDKIVSREEAMQSNLIEKAFGGIDQAVQALGGPSVPNPARAFNRAYTGTLNYIRFKTAKDLLAAARLLGEDVKMGSQTVRDIARVINDATGRGALGKADRLSNAAVVANLFLWAPRKLSATMNMLNPARFVTLTPTARKAAIQNLMGSLLVTSTLLGLAKSMGANVEWTDMTHQDWGKADFNGYKFDLTGGNAPYARLIARLITNTITTSKGVEKTLGEGYKADTRADLIIDFMRGKLAPTTATVVNAMYGSDAIGRPFSLNRELEEKITPMAMGSFADFVGGMQTGDMPYGAAVFASLVPFGAGLTTPTDYTVREGMNVWGEPERSTSEDTQLLNQAMKELKYSPSPVPNTINGIKLTDKQYQDYIFLSGQDVKASLLPLVQDPGWSSLPEDVRLTEIRSQFRNSRALIQEQIKAESVGTDNDIIQKSEAKKELEGQ